MQFSMLFYLGKEIMPAVRILGLRVLWSGTVSTKTLLISGELIKPFIFLSKQVIQALFLKL